MDLNLTAAQARYANEVLEHVEEQLTDATRAIFDLCDMIPALWEVRGDRGFPNIQRDIMSARTWVVAWKQYTADAYDRAQAAKGEQPRKAEQG